MRSRLFFSVRRGLSDCERLQGAVRSTATSQPSRPTPFLLPALHHALQLRLPAPSHNGAPPFARSMPNPSQLFDAKTNQTGIILRLDVAVHHLFCQARTFFSRKRAQLLARSLAHASILK